eukprot:10460409-Karenia_brevis.AAC.1
MAFAMPPSHRPRFHPKKTPEAVITCDLVDIASISIPSQFEPPQIHWKPGGGEQFSIDKGGVV